MLVERCSEACTAVLQMTQTCVQDGKSLLAQAEQDFKSICREASTFDVFLFLLFSSIIISSHNYFVKLSFFASTIFNLPCKKSK